MPWLALKGLFPGLAIGRGMPMPWAELKGLLPGLGIPKIEEAAAAADSAACGSATTGSRDAGVGAAGEGGAGARTAGEDSTATSGATGAGEAGFGAVGLSADLSALGSGAFSTGFSTLGNDLRSLAATGGAIVEEPPFTYSPSSSSFARATFVSMPSSLAKSYTRGSANYFSPVWGLPKQGRRYC